KSVLSILQQISGAGIYEGTVKYITGEYKDRPTFILQASLSLMLIGILISIALYFAFSDQLYALLQLSENESNLHPWLICGLLLSLLCFVLHTLMQSFFHGLKLYQIIVRSTLISSLLTLGLSIPLIYYFNTLGLMVSVFIPSVSLLLTYLFHFRSTLSFGWMLFGTPFRFHIFKPILSFTVMSAVAAMVFPSVLIVIRSLLVEHVGVQLASYWEGYSRLSLFISSLAISSISLYYLPKLVEANTGQGLFKVVLWGVKFLAIVALPALIIMLLLGSYIIPLLYSSSFLETIFLLKWELLGTFLKLLSFSVSFIMIAKKLTTVFVMSELISGLLFLGLSMFFIDKYGVVGASIAYTGTYFLYLLWSIIYFGSRFKFFEKD
ncbi:MAG: polysaccharide biosynthesis C-terminal domain-containing protein, partial [Flavobacteriaceae bacterium]